MTTTDIRSVGYAVKVDTWTVRVLKDGQWVTEHEGTRFSDARRIWDASEHISVLLRNGKALPDPDLTTQLTLET